MQRAPKITPRDVGGPRARSHEWCAELVEDGLVARSAPPGLRSLPARSRGRLHGERRAQDAAQLDLPDDGWRYVRAEGERDCVRHSYLTPMSVPKGTT